MKLWDMYQPLGASCPLSLQSDLPLLGGSTSGQTFRILQISVSLGNHESHEMHLCKLPLDRNYPLRRFELRSGRSSWCSRKLQQPGLEPLFIDPWGERSMPHARMLKATASQWMKRRYLQYREGQQNGACTESCCRTGGEGKSCKQLWPHPRQTDIGRPNLPKSSNASPSGGIADFLRCENDVGGGLFSLGRSWCGVSDSVQCKNPHRGTPCPAIFLHSCSTTQICERAVAVSWFFRGSRGKLGRLPRNSSGITKHFESFRRLERQVCPEHWAGTAQNVMSTLHSWLFVRDTLHPSIDNVRTRPIRAIETEVDLQRGGSTKSVQGFHAGFS